MIHSHMILTFDNTTWFFVIVFNPFYVCFEPFGFRFHTLYDLIMSREIPYHAEGDCGVPALSDASGTQSENPKSAEVDMPYVLKLSMGFGKLPLPNKKMVRQMVDAHFRLHGGNMEGLGRIRKTCFSTRAKDGLFLWIECEREVISRFWAKNAIKLAGDTGTCEQMPKEWVKKQLQKDQQLAEKSEVFSRNYASSGMLAVAKLSTMLNDRASTKRRRRGENKLTTVLVETNVVSKQFVRASTGESVSEAVKVEELENETDSDSEVGNA